MWFDFTIFYYVLLNFTIYGVILLYFSIFWMWGEERPITVAAQIKPELQGTRVLPKHKQLKAESRKQGCTGHI